MAKSSALRAQLRGRASRRPAAVLPPGGAGVGGVRHAALLLAELDLLEAAHLPHLLACLANPVDLTRYRAQAVLDSRTQTPVCWGMAYVEALACDKNASRVFWPARWWDGRSTQ